MYKIIFGIPVWGEEIVEDMILEDDEDYWCDFAVEYNIDDNYFHLTIETCLGFEGDNGCRNWMIHCLSEFTDYMDRHNLDKTKELDMYEVFTKGVNVKSHFKTIEDVYAFMKLMIFGFHGVGMFDKYY